MALIIDSHIHVWELHHGEYQWLQAPEFKYLQKDFATDDVLAELTAAGVSGVILVEASLTLAETKRLLATAARHSAVTGVVGWIPLDNPADTQSNLDLPASEHLVAIRHWSCPKIIDEHGKPCQEVIAALEVLAETDLSFEIIVWSLKELAPVRQLAAAIPQLRVIVDHMAGLEFSAEGTALDNALWKSEIQALAALPNLFIKFSGWTTPCRSRVEADQVTAPLAYVIENFGANRVLYGGDWPPASGSCSYSTLLEQSTRAISHCVPNEEDLILGKNVFAAYPKARQPR